MYDVRSQERSQSHHISSQSNIKLYRRVKKTHTHLRFNQLSILITNRLTGFSSFKPAVYLPCLVVMHNQSLFIFDSQCSPPVVYVGISGAIFSWAAAANRKNAIVSVLLVNHGV